MRNIISLVVLGALLIIVPLGSWFYLQRGLEYRKSALTELKEKKHLPEIPDSVNVFKGKTTLLFFDYQKASEILVPVVDQFKDAFTFQIAGSKNDNVFAEVPGFILDSLRMDGKLFAIVDTSGSVRNYYSSDMKDLKDMVEHLAIVLPQPKEKDIKINQ